MTCNLTITTAQRLKHHWSAGIYRFASRSRILKIEMGIDITGTAMSFQSLRNIFTVQALSKWLLTALVSHICCVCWIKKGGLSKFEVKIVSYLPPLHAVYSVSVINFLLLSTPLQYLEWCTMRQSHSFRCHCDSVRVPEWVFNSKLRRFSSGHRRSGRVANERFAAEVTNNSADSETITAIRISGNRKLTVHKRVDISTCTCTHSQEFVRKNSRVKKSSYANTSP